MSMVICGSCDLMIDSDDDPDCFVDLGNMRRLHNEVVMCPRCRDRHEVEAENFENASNAYGDSK